jgi:predicted transcriptional regulator
MPKPSLPRPTHAELAILRVLWKRGASTVRQVHDELGPDETGYTTILKFMQIMTQKRLLCRDDSQRVHVFTAAVPEETTQRQLVKDLIDRAFAGSARNLVLQALSTQKTTAGELAEIRQLIDDIERGGK